MKVLKYLFLLLILFLTASTIFVATLNPKYHIVRTQIIDVPQKTAFNYVNNLKNWEEFAAWNQNNTSFKFSQKSNGKGSNYKWQTGSDSGKITTKFLKPNDIIRQEMLLNNYKANLVWMFKDTLGRTKISCIADGQMGFLEKIFVNFSGGPDKILGANFEKNLQNINDNLVVQINNYKVVVNGYIQKSGGHYLHQTVYSKNENVAKNIQIMIKNLMLYCQKNNISVTGKPFVIYHKSDAASNITKFSVGISLPRQIILASNSGYAVSYLSPFMAVKTSLYGDYSHFKNAKEKTLEYLYTFNLKEDIVKPRIEIYVKSKIDSHKAAEWITEIYTPARSNKVIDEPMVSKPIDTTVVITPTAAEDPINTDGN